MKCTICGDRGHVASDCKQAAEQHKKAGTSGLVDAIAVATTYQIVPYNYIYYIYIYYIYILYIYILYIYILYIYIYYIYIYYISIY